jgi:NAD(P)-dependent dehydrogenase (short-subunit alcohol dehydrogenase family)
MVPIMSSAKVAVVTGAGRGLGQRVAAGLAQRGLQVAVVARSSEQVDETVRLIRETCGTAIGVSADVSNVDSVQRMTSSVHDQFGAVSVLINAAGVFGPIQLVVDSDPQRWIETIAINTIGPYLTCRAFLRDMIDAGWGRIINFSSAAALHPPGPLNSAYGTSKVALNQFTRHLAAELNGTGVTVNVIHPGEVKTAMWAAIRDESQSTGVVGTGYRAWAGLVEKTGGDDPQKAVDLCLRLIDETDRPTSGKFLWIEDGMQAPIPSWD